MPLDLGAWPAQSDERRGNMGERPARKGLPCAGPNVRTIFHFKIDTVQRQGNDALDAWRHHLQQSLGARVDFAPGLRGTGEARKRASMVLDGAPNRIIVFHEHHRGHSTSSARTAIPVARAMATASSNIRDRCEKVIGTHAVSDMRYTPLKSRPVTALSLCRSPYMGLTRALRRRQIRPFWYEKFGRAPVRVFPL